MVVWASPAFTVQLEVHWPPQRRGKFTVTDKPGDHDEAGTAPDSAGPLNQTRRDRAACWRRPWPGPAARGPAGAGGPGPGAAPDSDSAGDGD
jgi:hypothetical protein